MSSNLKVLAVPPPIVTGKKLIYVKVCKGKKLFMLIPSGKKCQTKEIRKKSVRMNPNMRSGGNRLNYFKKK